MTKSEELSIGIGLTIRPPRALNPTRCTLSFDSLALCTCSRSGADHDRHQNHEKAATASPQEGDSSAQTSTVDDDNDWLRAMQEIAFEMAVDQIKSTINTILQKANADCYRQVLAFLQPYLTIQQSTAASAECIVNPRLMLQHRAFPAVGFVTGGDVSVSNVWIEPLVRVLKPCFPLVFVVNSSSSSASIRNVHELLQWILEQIHREKNLRESQAEWLQKQLEKPVITNTSAGSQSARRRRYMKRCYDQTYDDGPGHYDDSPNGSKATDKQLRQLTVEELLTRIVEESDELLRRSDSCGVFTEIFLTSSQENLQERLAQCDEALLEKIQVYEAEMDMFYHWIKKLKSTSELKIRLARHLYDQLLEAVKFLKEAKDFVVHDSEDDQMLCHTSNNFLKHVKQLEDVYLFTSTVPVSKVDRHRPGIPFCVLIFEQLESLSELEHGHFIADLVRILDHFGHFRIGMVFGVKTSTSNVLRRLVLNGESRRRVDLQLFKWKCAVTCFDPIFDLLFVDKEFPLFLSYESLKWLCIQYERSQSVELFVQHLKFALFLHLSRVPWSFLCLYLGGKRFPVSLASGRYANHETIRRLSGHFGDFPMDLDAAVEKRHELFRAGGSDHTETKQAKSNECLDSQKLKDAFHHVHIRQVLWKVCLQCLKDAFYWVLNSSNATSSQVTLAALSVSADSEWASEDVILVEEIASKIRDTTPMRGLVAMTKLWSEHLAEASGMRLLTNHKGLEETRKQVQDLHQICAHVDEDTANEDMIKLLREEIALVFVHKILGELLADPLSGATDHLVQLLAFDQVDALESSLHLVHYDNIVDGLETGSTRVQHFGQGENWLRDVMWCFRHYQESIGKNLSLRDWFEQFCTQHATVSSVARRRPLKRHRGSADQDVDTDEKASKSPVNELHARFVRSFALLKRFGFVRNLRSQLQDQNTIEKLVFI